MHDAFLARPLQQAVQLAPIGQTGHKPHGPMEIALEFSHLLMFLNGDRRSAFYFSHGTHHQEHESTRRPSPVDSLASLHLQKKPTSEKRVGSANEPCQQVDNHSEGIPGTGRNLPPSSRQPEIESIQSERVQGRRNVIFGPWPVTNMLRRQPLGGQVWPRMAKFLHLVFKRLRKGKVGGTTRGSALI
jgi:hypothetical protein